jgi:hypothetical protein
LTSVTTLNATGVLNTPAVNGATTLRLQTGGVDRVTVDAAGNAGLGVVPSANMVGQGLNIRNGFFGSLGGPNTHVYLSANAVPTGNVDEGLTTWVYKNSAEAARFDSREGRFRWLTAPSGTAGAPITFTQAMTLTQGGNLLVGGTTDTGTRARFESTNKQLGLTYTGIATYNLTTDVSGNLTIDKDGAERARITSGGEFLVGTTTTRARMTVESNSLLTAVPYDSNDTRNDTTSSASFHFRRLGTLVGNISTTQTATSFNTSSDYRLKENVQPIRNALKKVSSLKPCTYKWKADGSDGEGFIAHELAEVCPQAVTGQKDAVDSDGKPIYQGIDVSFLVGTLTAAIQELSAQNTALTDRIAALESK